jgi:hypothetical protein
MRKGIRYVLVTLAVMLLVGAGFLDYYLRTLTPRLKARVVGALQDRFDADVKLGDLQFSFFPVARVEGEELVINHKQWGNSDHPLIRIKRFHAETDYTTILDWRNRVNEVVLEGLDIDIPSRGRATLKTTMEANQPVSSGEPGHDTTHFKFLIQTIIANRSMVEIQPKTPDKEPLRFPVEKLIMHSVGPDEAMTFTARLTNAKPPGGIDTAGHFGPWQKDDPRATPISGDYTFQNADLSVFPGISGILSSQGRYGGVMQHINVDGTTDTPDFRLQDGGAPVHLTTRFHSVVDGTNGDTILDPVDAKFRHSEFVCSGGAVQQPGTNGKSITLDAHTTYGRIEDILALIVKGPPLLKGAVQFGSKIVIPPGKEQVIRKLGLNGQFNLTSAVFTSEKDAERLLMLSDRASGISKEDERRGEGAPGKVASNMAARFRLARGVISFASLAVEVPGAHLQLTGNYNVLSSQIDMRGSFAMRATLSQTQSGFKAILLKPLDRYFRRDGAGFELPFSISGTRDRPAIGVTVFHRTFVIH